MREMKFRAWIPAKEVGEQDYHSDGKAEMFYQEDQYLQSFLRRAYMMDCGREHESYISEGFTLLQYTGLKDKNGAEIYEGDVVRFKAWKGKHQGAVKWNGATCGFEIEMSPTSHTGFFQDPLRTYEVIGNVHENPELLADGGE
jgi:uncharacterized phage protein (TIGR01671 family)